MRRIGLLLGFAAIAGCGPDGASVGDEQADGFDDGRTLVQKIEPHRRAPRVDILFVVDDSASMRPFQANLAANASAFADVIDAEDVEADARIAITTTSVPSPACASEHAQGGEPIVASCRAHLDDFVGPDEHGELGGAVEDHRAICEDACGQAEIPRVPSLGHDDHDLGSLAIRPWIEAANNPFGGNLDGVELEDALTCALLQGFNGCAFESPIEAAARMVERMADPSDPMSEFRRADAGFQIVLISDEDDCSHSDASTTIFDPAGDRTFWADLDAAEATSGICIRAGLECDAEGCVVTDHALDGSPTEDPASAVLTPPDRLHAALVAAGEYDVAPWEPMISSVGGFTHNGTVHYTSPDAELDTGAQTYFDAFGVVPGCAVPSPDPLPDLRAAPGGRIGSIATPDSLYSICADDYTPVLEVWANHIKPGWWPACINFECVANREPESPTLVPDCVVEEVDYASERNDLPECLRDANGWVIDPALDYALPVGAHACWMWRTDSLGLTSDLEDDMSPECVEDELPAEMSIARRPGSLLPYDSHYELRCRPCSE